MRPVSVLRALEGISENLFRNATKMILEGSGGLSPRPKRRTKPSTQLEKAFSRMAKIASFLDGMILLCFLIESIPSKNLSGIRREIHIRGSGVSCFLSTGETSAPPITFAIAASEAKSA